MLVNSKPDVMAKIWLLGPDSQWVIFFSKIHTCVCKKFSVTGVSFWGMYVGVPNPPKDPPPTHRHTGLSSERQ